MTHSYDHNRRRVEAGVTPDDDDLDAFLNTTAAADGPSAASNESEASSLAAGAREFHRRLNEAQVRDPASAQPDSRLWDRILADAGSHRKDDAMSPTPLSLDAQLAPVDPRPRHSAVSVETARHSRLGRWANIIAAVSLVLLIGVGYWFSGYGPGGSNPTEPGRYAAQVVSPIASPEAQQTTCTVEPLTADEVIVRIADPDGWVAQHTGERMPFTPGALTDPAQLIRPTGADMGLNVPDVSEFEAMQQATNQYLDCMREGSMGQLWAVLAPHMLQREIFGRFPTYRAEADVRAYVDENLDAPAAGFWFPSTVWDVWGDVRLEAVPDSEEARVDPIFDPVLFGYVPSQGVEPDGTVIAKSDWHDRIEALVETKGPAPSLGAITLVQYPGSAHWFINDIRAMTLDTESVASPVADTSDIVITAQDVEYDVTQLPIPANTDVKITVANKGFLEHDFVVDELDIQSGPLLPGEQADVTINAAPGTYTYYCSVPGHQDAGQEGTLIVD